MRSTTRLAAALAAAFAATMLSGHAVQAAPAPVAPAPAAPAGDGRAAPVIPDRDGRAGKSVSASQVRLPYWLFNANSGKCLTVQGASKAESARTLQFTCDSNTPFNEEWFLDANGDGTYKIVNNHSGKCLTVQSASLANGTPVIQYTCNDTAPFNERWEFVDLDEHPADHWYHIRNVHSGSCLTIHGASTANNAFGVQYTCDNRNAPYNEEWMVL
jgi:hypothetical protein